MTSFKLNTILSDKILIHSSYLKSIIYFTFVVYVLKNCILYKTKLLGDTRKKIIKFEVVITSEKNAVELSNLMFLSLIIKQY